MEETSEGRHVITPETNNADDQVKTIVRLLSVVLNSEFQWPEGTNEFLNQLKEMKMALDDDSIKEQEGDNMMIDTSSKTNA